MFKLQNCFIRCLDIEIGIAERKIAALLGCAEVLLVPWSNQPLSTWTGKYYYICTPKFFHQFEIHPLRAFCLAFPRS